jgi:hypothetical protein
MCELKALPVEQSTSWEPTSDSAAQQIHVFYGTRRFITTFTRVPRQPPSLTKRIQFTPPTVFLRSISIFSCHLLLGLSSYFFFGTFKQFFCAFVISPCALHTSPISPFFIWWNWLYLAKGTNVEAPRRVVFSVRLLTYSSGWLVRARRTYTT